MQIAGWSLKGTAFSLDAKFSMKCIPFTVCSVQRANCVLPHCPVQSLFIGQKTKHLTTKARTSLFINKNLLHHTNLKFQITRNGLAFKGENIFFYKMIHIRYNIGLLNSFKPLHWQDFHGNQFNNCVFKGDAFHHKVWRLT